MKYNNLCTKNEHNSPRNESRRTEVLYEMQLYALDIVPQLKRDGVYPIPNIYKKIYIYTKGLFSYLISNIKENNCCSTMPA